MTHRGHEGPAIVAACAALTLIAACGTESGDDGDDGTAPAPSRLHAA